MRLIVVGLVLLAGMMPTALAAQPHCLRGTYASESATQRLYATEVAAALEAGGLCVTFAAKPLRRAAAMLSTGESDLDLMRVAAFFAATPDVVQVPFPLLRSAGIALSRVGHEVSIQGVEDLAARDVAYRLGAMWAVDLARRHDANAVPATSIRAAIRMLQIGRVEAVLINASAHRAAATANWYNPDLLRPSPVLTELEFFPALARDDAALAARIRAALADHEARKGATFATLIERALFQSVTPVLRYAVMNDGSWVPYEVVRGEAAYGIAPDILQVVMMEAGIRVEPTLLSARAVEEAIALGVTDVEVASPAWFPGGVFPNGDLQSDSLIWVEDHIYRFAGAPEIESAADLAGQRVATVAGYTYRNADTFIRVDYPGEREVLAAVNRGEVPYGIVEATTADFWLTCDGLTAQKSAIHSAGMLRLRLRKGLVRFLPRINAAIEALQQDGRMARLIGRYGPEALSCDYIN